MKHTLFTVCTLFNLKKLKRFLNITEYKMSTFKYVWEPFPHIKFESVSECGVWTVLHCTLYTINCTTCIVQIDR